LPAPIDKDLTILTVTLDWAILHIIVYHSSAFTYTANFTEIEKSFWQWTDVHTLQTDRWRSWPKMGTYY